MILSRRSLVASVGATAAALAFPKAAAAAVSAVLTPAAMRADLDLLRHAYTSVHPGLDRYLGRGAFAAQIDAAKQWAARERSLPDMFLMLARLTAAVRCGHSYPNPNNQRSAIQSALFAGRDRLPFAFRWIGGRMIVTGGRGGAAALPRGSEVIAIDGVRADRTLRMMMPLARADGDNDAKRVAQLGLDPRERYAAFDLYRTMVMPAGIRGVAAIRFRLPGGSERRVDLPLLTEAELAATRGGDAPNLGWTFAIDGAGVGRLTMPNWVTYRSQWDWRAWLDAAVDQLIEGRARGLVVDLRGNEGGTECGWHLLERIVDREIPRPAFDRRVRYRSAPEALRSALDTWDDSFRDWGAAASGPDRDGFFALTRPDDGAEAPTIRPRGRRFTGPVVVLVDAACSSATFQFAHAIRQSGAARLIGEPTGGNRRGINGGAYFFVRLPATGLEVDLPIIGYFAQVPQPDAGVVPHQVVPVTARDIASGRDRQMEAAVAYLRRS